MQVNILLFATLKDRAGKSRLVLDVPDNATILTVRNVLSEAYPEMEVNVELAIAALNQEFAVDTDVVRAGDEIAFFPPVSGGNHPPEIFRLADAPVNHDEIVASITTPDTGAVCLFSGMVRGKTEKEGHLPNTMALEYEAYAPMALAKMKQVADEIRTRWTGVIGIAIVQRIGQLRVGENTVLIACSSAHRDDGCFEAARYGIDRLKEIVPVWKKEIGEDGAVWIEGDYMPTVQDKYTAT
ncbi:MAG: molybdenum cofactor biosynthesis protein MoaE [Anaerolineae bacterium]|jgi:molybdopterin synthase catalytic subunit|nr:molybdenum cofactor biosynthesis protein MoaE [Anaerolineae bacterium]